MNRLGEGATNGQLVAAVNKIQTHIEAIHESLQADNHELGDIWQTIGELTMALGQDGKCCGMDGDCDDYLCEADDCPEHDDTDVTNAAPIAYDYLRTVVTDSGVATENRVAAAKALLEFAIDAQTLDTGCSCS